MNEKEPANITPSYTLSITNKAIWEFFQANPTFTFESCVQLTVQLMDTVIQSVQQSTDKSEAGILSKVQTQILSSLEHIESAVLRLPQHQTSAIQQFKDEYKQSFETHRLQQLQLQQQQELQQDKTHNELHALLQNKLQESGDQMVHKICTHIGESIPHNVSEQLAEFRQSLQDEMRHLLHGQLTSESIQLFLDRFETKTTQLLHSAQQPLYACLSATESRLRADLGAIQSSQQSNQPVYETMADFLNKNKYKNSSAKGRFGEARMEEMMTTLYPHADIVNTTGVPNSGDFYIKDRGHGMPDILVETKEYTRNVSKEEVDKFIRDVVQQKRHGVMISHTSGIAGKRPYEIEVHQKWIVVYVASAMYEPERLKIATDMIDSMTRCLDPYLSNATQGAQITIPPATIRCINIEYSKFIEQKLEMANSIRTLTADMQRTLLNQMAAIQFPELARFIDLKKGSIMGASVAKPAAGPPQYKPPTIKDTICGEYAFKCSTEGCSFIGKSARSLSGHYRKCRREAAPPFQTHAV